VIIPFFRKDESENARVLEQGQALIRALEAEGISAKLDAREGPPGPKFYEYERQGVPLRFGLGPRDLQARTVEFKRRDKAEKESAGMDNLAAFAKDQAAAMQNDLRRRALERRKDNTVSLDSYADLVELMKAEEGKFVLAHWDGTRETEAKVKQETGATIRCIPLDGQGFDSEPGKCVVTGKPSARRVIWAKAY
jgi:prolyl-tRNA synthetase